MKITDSINKYIDFFENVIVAGDNDILQSVYLRVSSSHEPVFILDKNRQIFGIVSLNESLYKHRYPYHTKINSCVFQPPKILPETPIYQAVEFMLSTRLYILPVFNDDKNGIIGLVKARRILKLVSNDNQLLKEIIDSLKIKEPITSPINSSVKDVYNYLRQKGISRIILVDGKGKLSGIISRRDLLTSFISTVKQRYSTRYGKPKNYSFDEEKLFRVNFSARNYCKRNVLSIPSGNIFAAVKRMIDSDLSSIVIVDDNHKPKGLITTRDILEAIIKEKPRNYIPIIFKKPSENINNRNYLKALNLLQKFGQKVQKSKIVKHILFTIDEPKSSQGKTILYIVKLKLELINGESYVAQKKAKSFLTAVRNSIKTVDSQLRRSKKKIL